MRKFLIPASRVIFMLALLFAAQPVATRSAHAATFTVTNTSDSGAGSLRQAIVDANSNPGSDIIAFNIPATDPGYSNLSNAWVIQPNTLLPSLSGGATTIDGHTQTTNQGDTNLFGPEVQLDGSNLAATDWMLSVESNDNAIKGLAITRAGGAGIRIRSGSRQNSVIDNYIGTLPTGVLASGNGTGVELSTAASANTIQGNVISGNVNDGVMISDSGTDSNYVKNNVIGLNPTGAVAIPNGGHGIIISGGAAFNSMGGDVPDRNVISGNGKSGVAVQRIVGDGVADTDAVLHPLHMYTVVVVP